MGFQNMINSHDVQLVNSSFGALRCSFSDISNPTGITPAAQPSRPARFSTSASELPSGVRRWRPWRWKRELPAPGAAAAAAAAHVRRCIDCEVAAVGRRRSRDADSAGSRVRRDGVFNSRLGSLHTGMSVCACVTGRLCYIAVYQPTQPMLSLHRT